jgi:AcrR family transcriptional regulator
MSTPKSGGDVAGGVPRLPPGRHGLPREFVAENQRQRIAAAVIEVMVTHGYNDANVMQIITAAGISRRTFYDYYDDKQEAFFDVYRQVVNFVVEAMEEAGRSRAGGWPAQVRSRLTTLLDVFAANPDLVRFCLVVPPAAGGEVAAAYRRFLEQILAVLREGWPKRAKQPPPAAEYGLVGGLAALIVERVEEGEEDGIKKLLPEVTELVLTPYLGREAAAQAASATGI